MVVWLGKCLNLGGGCSLYYFPVESGIVSQFPCCKGEDYTRDGAILPLASMALGAGGAWVPRLLGCSVPLSPS